MLTATASFVPLYEDEDLKLEARGEIATAPVEGEDEWSLMWGFINDHFDKLLESVGKLEAEVEPGRTLTCEVFAAHDRSAFDVDIDDPEAVLYGIWFENVEAKKEDE